MINNKKEKQENKKGARQELKITPRKKFLLLGFYFERYIFSQKAGKIDIYFR